MTLIIENVKEEYVPAFREFAKKMNANLTAESSDDECPICKAHDYRFEPNDRLLEAIREVENGDTIKFSTHSEMMKYLQSDSK
ncbi:hypothetical protein [Helicobacter sp. 23-1045]